MNRSKKKAFRIWSSAERKQLGVYLASRQIALNNLYVLILPKFFYSASFASYSTAFFSFIRDLPTRFARLKNLYALSYSQKELIELFSMTPEDAIRYVYLHRSRQSLFEIRLGDIISTIGPILSVDKINKEIELIASVIHQVDLDITLLTSKYNMCERGSMRLEDLI